MLLMGYGLVFSKEGIDFPGCSSLGFFDISLVRPSAHCERAQEENQPSVALVVEAIGFVPLWEFTGVLMCELGEFTWLGISWNLWVDFVLWEVGETAVSTRVAVGIVEHVLPPRSLESCLIGVTEHPRQIKRHFY